MVLGVPAGRGDPPAAGRVAGSIISADVGGGEVVVRFGADDEQGAGWRDPVLVQPVEELGERLVVALGVLC